MRIFFLFFTLLFLNSSFASEWTKELEHHLPEKVQKINPGTTSKPQVHASFGKPHFKKGSKEYWALNNFKYALEVNFDGPIVKSYHYSFQKGPLLNEVPSLSGKKFKSIPSIPNEKKFSSGKESVTYTLTSGRITGYKEEM